MKFREWLLPIVSPLFKKKEEAELFVSASGFDVDIPDETAAEFTKTYLTRERALSDEHILEKVNKDSRGRVFASVDLKLENGVISKLAKEDQDAINAEKNTLLKVEMLGKALDNLAKNDDVKKANEAARKKEEELRGQIKTLEETVSKKDSIFAKQVNEVKLDYALRNKVLGFELAPEFSVDKHKNFLADSTIASLKKNFVLEFDEKDASIIHLRKTVDGQIVDHFEGNVKQTLDDVLKKEYDPYIKKSTAGDSPDQQTPQKQTIKLPTDKPLTLEDRRLAAAGVS